MENRMILFPRSPRIPSHMKEVILADTYNFKSGKPILGGLFGEDIFGPVSDYTCHCKAMAGMKYRGHTCEKCGVDITLSKERSQRFGYIKLHIPVFHPLNTEYIKYLVPALGNKDAFKEFLFKSYKYIVYLEEDQHSFLRDINNTPVSVRIDEATEDNQNQGNIGIIGLVNAFIDLDAEKTHQALEGRNSTLETISRRVSKYATFAETFFLFHVLVTPPDMRPIIKINGSYKVHSINQLYLTILRRNIRIAALMSLDQADSNVILSEWFILNKLVNMLMLGGGTLAGEEITGILANIGGKQGHIRNELLGKRVDFSGRTVVIAGPELEFGHVGIPEEMAYELLKLHIIQALVKQGLSLTRADKLWKAKDPRAWSAMWEFNKKVRVMLNRQPSLHRWSVGSFLMDIIPGKSIAYHPACYSPMNLDNDGDTMAVYIHHGQDSQVEQEMLMTPQQNIKSATNGEVLMGMNQEYVFGLHVIGKVEK